MTTKLSLRLKLTDFINTEMESEIMEKINHSHNKLRIAVMLHLWFDEDEINNKDLKEFLMRWEDKLSFKTIVKQGSSIRMSDFIWFDIVPSGTSYNSRKRFQFGYNKNKFAMTDIIHIVLINIDICEKFDKLYEQIYITKEKRYYKYNIQKEMIFYDFVLFALLGCCCCIDR